ncbi:hypothetical protein IQ247_19660, partial [Plectonema cf. radiosum LEGE 06105]|nr:hypothetical protein [Plectonema cf. radiosum LEGE 06105]
MVGTTRQSDLVVVNTSALRSLTRAISLSRGEFSLVLVCCNYKVLQQRILEQLQQILGKDYLLQKVSLPAHARSLYTTIHTKIVKDSKKNQTLPHIALMILGLESVNGLDDLLTSINHIRDEFRKKHPFPMVLWVNEEVLRKLRRLAPDFASWAGTPIKFEMTTAQLIQFLQRETESLFTTVLDIAATREKASSITQKKSSEHRQCTLEQVWQHSNELHHAIKDLQTRGINLTPELDASLEFVFGLDEYVKDCIEKAINHFRKSYQLLIYSYQKKDEVTVSSPSPCPPIS